MLISKRNCLLFGFVIILIGCSRNSNNKDSETTEIDKPDSKATEIVQRSINKHGGWMNWVNANSISYKKTIILFDSSGKEESRISQYHRYQLKPDLQGTIDWVSNNDSIRVVYSEGVAKKYINNVEDMQPESRESALSTMLSSFYVLFQPFKLMDNGTQLIYKGEELLETGTKVYIVQPIYEGAKEGDDRWWYYFDKETDLLVANMVNHDPTYSYIVNLKYDNTTALTFNAHRKSYFVDSLRNVRYLRAEYFYEDFQLNYPE